MSISIIGTYMPHALASTLLAALSFALWRIAYLYTDWAALALIPFVVVIAYGSWSLAMDPWRAKLHIIVRQESILARFITGKIRAFIITTVFTSVAVIVIALKTLNASNTELLIMLSGFFISAFFVLIYQLRFSQYFHHPFDRSIAVSTVTWFVATPTFLLIAFNKWALDPVAGEMLDVKNLADVVSIMHHKLPFREGWITTIISIFYSYEAIKIFAVIRFSKYLFVSVIYSLDAALFSYVLCRTAAVSTLLIKLKTRN